MKSLPSPFDVAAPGGAQGWERMYPAHMLFSEDNRAWEEGVLRTIRWYAENRDRWIGRVDWLQPAVAKSPA